jgi:hypothetical protein
MTTAAQPIARLRSVGERLASSYALLWAVFVLVHLWLGYLNLSGPGQPFGDVTVVYRYWAEQAVYAHYVVGVNGPFVYPVLALLPMLGASVFGFNHYGSSWLSGVMLLDLVAFAFLVGWGRNRRSLTLGWWWVGFLILLGPIAIGRIDSVTTPIALVGVLFIASRPRLAAVLLTVGAWVKIWPAAVVAALVIASKARARILWTAVVTSVTVVAIALVFGAGSNVFSFITQQTGRGLQIEAPISTFWMWQAFAHQGGAAVYYDTNILTFQIAGRGVDVAGALMTPLMVIAVAAIAALGILAMRRGAAVTELLPVLVLALVSALIVFNKVGSPQFMTWLAVPVLLGLATHATGHGRSFRLPAAMALVLAALTQVFYPTLYDFLLRLNPVMLIVLTLRNALMVGLLGWAVSALVQLSRRWVDHELNAENEGWLPVIWPLGPLAGGTPTPTIPHPVASAPAISKE